MRAADTPEDIVEVCNTQERHIQVTATLLKACQLLVVVLSLWHSLLLSAYIV